MNDLAVLPDDTERFYRMVNKKDDGCWTWLGAPSHGGYGAIKVQGRRILAHRFAWLIEHGVLPDNLDVLHTCDNPLCVRPDHLFLGTQQDNVKDMVLKHRQARGTRKNTNKLTEEQVLIVRKMGLEGISERVIAAHVGCSRRNVRSILSGKSWSWLR